MQELALVLLSGFAASIAFLVFEKWMRAMQRRITLVRDFVQEAGWTAPVG